MLADTLRRMHAGFDPEPYYSGLYTSRRPHTPGEFTLDRKVELESWRTEVLLSQPLPPLQYDLPPRRSPAAGMRLEKPGKCHTEMQQMEQRGIFSFQADVDSVFPVDCMRIREQEGMLSFQTDVGVNPETTDITVQVAACQEVMKMPISQQQQGGGIDQSKQAV